MSELFGSNPVTHWGDLWRLLARLGLDLLFATLVIRFVYYRLYRNREYVFTYYLFNLVTLCLCLLLRKVPTELGFALALFGVFGIMRYRTDQIRVRDLTYLFIVIGLGVLNGIANASISLAELLTVNGIIVALTALLELRPWKHALRSTPLLYDQLDHLRPENQARLLADIRERTGLDAVRVEVDRVDLLRDAAELTVHHK